MRCWNVRHFVAALSMAATLMSSAAVADEQQSGAQMSAPMVAASARYAPAFEVSSAPSVPVRHIYRAPRVAAKPTFFQRVMELERRKNAWLMRTFLGR